MTKPPDKPIARPLMTRGRLRIVECAVDARGQSPALEFVESLSDSDQDKVTNLFQRLANLGEIGNREKFKLLEGKIWQFKSYQIRIPCFQDGRSWVLTHGFIKKQDAASKSEIKRAIRIQGEDLARRKPPARGKG